MTPDLRLDDFATEIVEQEGTDLEVITVEVEVSPVEE